MSILGQKGANLNQNGPKWAGLKFSRTPNLNFLKEDHKISFYTKKLAKFKAIGGKGVKTC